MVSGKNRRIVVEKLAGYKPRVEMVERKGIGHPDSICDGIAEEISISLSKYYLEEFGTILHHNVDKGLLVGGEARPEFGGGEVISPIKIISAGRATKLVGEKLLPVDEIAREATYRYLSRFRNLDPELNVETEVEIRPGSIDLVGLFKRKEKIPLANDTSFGLGFWPLDDLEKLVLEVERFLNSDDYHKKRPWIGEDIKVMGLRDGDEVEITVAAAFVSKYIPDLDSYLDYKEKVLLDLESFSKSLGIEAKFYLNTADEPEAGIFYLTVTGLSAESGDDGQVGRGNRANGLITPYRFMSLEATAGKNPVNHVGKIYNALANQAARHIYEELGIENEVVLLSRIGQPIDQPFLANIRLLGLENGEKGLEEKARYILESELENVQEMTWRILERKVQLF